MCVLKCDFAVLHASLALMLSKMRSVYEGESNENLKSPIKI